MQDTSETLTHATRSVPPNVEFFVDDLEEDWAFADDFDFIYARMLNGSIRDWPRFARQAYRYGRHSLVSRGHVPARVRANNAR